MAGDLLSKWLSWWQPLGSGLSRGGLANGLLLTGGWFWTRVRGGYLLYRGLGDRGQIDWSQPVGAAGADAREIREFSWISRGPAGSYWYGVRTIGPGGIETDPPTEVTGCGIADDGTLLGGLPGDIERVWAQVAHGGQIVLHWRYAATYEAARPSEFRIYQSDSTGQVDYTQPIATLAWDLRRPVYTWTSEPYESGARVRLGVRPANAAGEGIGAEVDVAVCGCTQAWPALMLIEEVADGT